MLFPLERAWAAREQLLYLGVLGEAQGVKGAAGVLPLLCVRLVVPQGLGAGNGNKLLLGPHERQRHEP